MTDIKKHINIPIFIPHLGCPNQCVFCNQRKISGKNSFEIENVRAEIDRAVSSIDYEKSEAEIAFFGGSFTGIDRRLMCDLLDIAQEYVDSGKAASIRLSTRPDYISEEILDILSLYSVRTVELGIQSVCDSVLLACKRGHTLADTEKAVRLVTSRGFELVGQMMTGLPGATGESEIATARFICDCGAVAARIYPTVVFRDTELCEMAKRGEYLPLDNSEAVGRAADVLEVFIERNIPVIRIGLCASENLSDENEVYAGANHSALGEMVMGRVYYNRIVSELCKQKASPKGKNIKIFVPRGEISKAVGQHGENREKIKRQFETNRVKIVEKDGLMLYNIILVIE